MLVDLYLVYQFLRRLTTPFEEWDAFKTGVIDKDGNILKKKDQRKTQEEKDSLRVFDLMILKLKKLLAKVPGGESKLASYAAALWLIREWNHFSDSSILTEDVSEEVLDESLELFSERYFYYTTLAEGVNQKNELNELFDKPYPYKLDLWNANPREPKAKATLPDNTTLEVYFTKNFPNKRSWDVYFSRDGSLDKTNSGDEYKVFSTVLSIIADFIREQTPLELTFSADKTTGGSRADLYSRMIKRFASSHGFQLSAAKEKYGAQYFTLIKAANEEVPANNVGSGNIAGLGVGPQGEPGLTRSQQKRHKKRAAATANPTDMLKRRKLFSDFLKDDLTVPNITVADTVVGEPGTGDTATSGYRPKKRYKKHVRTYEPQ